MGPGSTKGVLWSRRSRADSVCNGYETSPDWNGIPHPLPIVKRSTISVTVSEHKRASWTQGPHLCLTRHKNTVQLLIMNTLYHRLHLLLSHSFCYNSTKSLVIFCKIKNMQCQTQKELPQCTRFSKACTLAISNFPGDFQSLVLFITF